ncbi:hypothetical protein GCM10028812_08720 [Ancylobacter sonchi]|nr:DUF6538 domain-containing protein [Ancylobacter sonchi]
MARPIRRPESPVHGFRSRVPADVLQAARGRTMTFSFPSEGGEPGHVAVATVGEVVTFSLRTRSLAIAKSRNGIATAYLERQWEALRSGPAPLSHKQVVSLSGEIYRLFVERFGEEPGGAETWSAVTAFNRAAREGRIVAALKLSTENAENGSGCA